MPPQFKSKQDQRHQNEFALPVALAHQQWGHSHLVDTRAGSDYIHQLIIMYS